MKATTAIITALALASVLSVVTGCNQQSASSTNETNSVASPTATTASNAWQSTKEGSSNAWETTKSATTNAWDATKEAGSNVWHKTAAAFGAMGETNSVSTNYFAYDYSQKDDFVSQAKAGIDNLDQRISGISGQLAAATGGTKTDLQEKLQDITSRRSDLSSKYDAVKSATQDSWTDAKAAFIKSYFDLKATVKSAEDSAKAGM